jgi:hypothetical protein
MYPASFHPIHTHKTRDFRGQARYLTRTQATPKYYLVDFGISRKYEADARPPNEPIILGGDKSPPEHKLKEDKTPVNSACDPFPTDVYFVGNMIRTNFFEVSYLIRTYKSMFHRLHRTTKVSTSFCPSSPT